VREECDVGTRKSQGDGSGSSDQIRVSQRRERDLDGAIAEYRKAIRLKPDYAEAHAILGVALYGKGERQAALEEYRKASELDPKNAALREIYERLSKELKK